MIGIGLGLFGALPAMKVLESVPFDVSILDPSVIALTGASMVIIALLAGFLLASRAASVDPMTVLRNED